MELIEHKAAGDKVVTRPESDEKAPRKGSDLMAALEASLAKNRAGAKSGKPTRAHAATNGHAQKRKSA
jgi:non-homologous end joining protein Ku